ncbi:MAG: hypothetical protein Q9170_008283, partial [Blastenia crenularia]
MASPALSQASTAFESDAPQVHEEQKAPRKAALRRVKEAATSQDILLFLIAFRILNALSIRTFFQPDEYFQSLEPAWEIAFGANRGAWITWEWKNQLRSAIHPALFAAVYRLSVELCKLFQLSPFVQDELLLAAPKLTQAVIAALGDYYTWKLGERVYGNGSNEAWAATTLTVVALHQWPWHWSLDATGEEPVDQYGLREDQKPEQAEELAKRERLFLVLETVICGAIVLVTSAIVDRLYYQQWAFPPLRFLYFNLAQSLSVHYGRNDWHYYLSQGYPLLLTTFLPFALVGLYHSLFPQDPPPNQALLTTNIRRQLANTSLLVPFILSFISHKEVRFIYPLLPPLHILSAAPFTTFFLPLLSPSMPKPRNPPTKAPSRTTKRLLLTLILTTNLLLSVLTTQYHQPAPLTVLSYLRSRASSIARASPTNPMTISFLTPCHSTPWRSHLLHSPSILKAWALSCEPPLHLPRSQHSTYLDEADQFYQSPTHWLALNLRRPPKTI